MNYLLQLLYSFWRTLLLVIVFKSKIDSFYLMVIIVDIYNKSYFNNNVNFSLFLYTLTAIY